jgi:hypothetical protein
MFNFLKKKPATRPSRNQVVLCERLGLESTAKMSREDVSRMLEVALQQEKYKQIYDQIQKAKEAEFVKEDRATYGDTLIDELEKWQRYCDPHKQYILIFKRGQQVQFDVAEFETAEIIGGSKHSIQLGVLLPKLHKDKDTGDYLEWERELNLKPSEVLKIERLADAIDMFDIKTYQETKARCEAIANEYRA